MLQKPQRGALPALDEVDASKADPAIIRNFLQTGMREEIPDFVSEYLASFGNALDSMLFRQYVLLELRFSAIRAAKGFGYSQEEFLRPLGSRQMLTTDVDRDSLQKNCAALLRRAIDLREEESGNQYKSMLKRALRYIDQNYTDENLSLNTVAKAANISPNYFSGVFSQEMGQTFVEYLTEKRMERAKELLRYSGKRSSEVAYEVGYRDPRYFSFLFKKRRAAHRAATARETETGMKRNEPHPSLDGRLRRLLWSMLLLVCVILVATLAILLLHNHQYSIVTANIVRASQFNQNFKGGRRS